jgi:hypothetical protein
LKCGESDWYDEGHSSVYSLENIRGTEHASRDPSIYLDGMVLIKHTDNFHLITACDGISVFENCLLEI